VILFNGGIIPLDKPSHLVYNVATIRDRVCDMVIKDTVFEKKADSVKPDAKKRVVLHSIQIQDGICYHIYQNSFGQIILDPQVTIPASEIWLFNNPEAISSVRRGLLDAAQGRTSKVDLSAL
jgi:hypothetical protein